MQSYSLFYTYITLEFLSDATVALAKSSDEVDEGDGEVEVCVYLQELPTGGLETDIFVNLTANSGTAGVCYAMHKCDHRVPDMLCMANSVLNFYLLSS